MQGQDFEGRWNITHVNNCYQCVTWYIKIGSFLKENLICIFFNFTFQVVCVPSLCVCLCVCVCPDIVSIDYQWLCAL